MRAVMALACGLVASACASLSSDNPPALPWSGPGDCFSRSVLVSLETAGEVAATCAGPRAAADPSRSGVDRATAAFLAASAYNRLAEAGRSGPGCDLPADCHERAARLIAQSRTHQGDHQVSADTHGERPAPGAQFVARRTIEEARALAGLAQTGGAPGLCADRDDCLAAASARLSRLDYSDWPKPETGQAPELACATYRLRWEIDRQRATYPEPGSIDVLRTLAAECPAQQAEAQDALADISFNRAERGRALLASWRNRRPVPDEAIRLGLDAVADYSFAAQSGRLRASALRGAGEVYLTLADLDPGQAGDHLRAAIQSYESLEPVADAAGLSALGAALIDLAEIEAKAGQDASPAALYRRAVDALTQAVAIEPAPERQRLLGLAHAALGQIPQARAAYEAAIPGLSGEARLEARLALAGLLEQLGDGDAALAVLQAAAMQDPPSPEVGYQTGRWYFAAGDFGSALAALRPAEMQLAGAERAEAAYMLSVAEAALRDVGWQDRALAYAQAAQASDQRLWKYSRQACLAAIQKGDARALSDPSSPPCLDVSTPEARLLLGMRALKRAQQLDVSAYDAASQARWRSVLREAEDAFLDGQALLRGSAMQDRTSRFDDLRADIDLEARLADGVTVVRRCRREISIDPASPTWRDLEQFFGHYGVLRCSK